jgi:2-oxoglutarate/2-oxoacid ferredoxin oxidoreductase subunit alpha
VTELLSGNVAFAEAAIRAGCGAFFGYPITPQTEALEVMARRMPALGRTFVQAESEIAAIHMVLGASAAGVRAMTSSSSPGVSLMTEALSYAAGSRLPVVLVDVMRGGPGLGNIAPAQGDYRQVTGGLGHGDLRTIVLAPASVQEWIDLTPLAFELAERYRMVVVLLADGALGQLMEGATLPAMQPPPPPPAWALTGAGDGAARQIGSLHLDPDDQERVVSELQATYAQVAANEVRFETFAVDDARLLLVAFGTAARVARSAVRRARGRGIALGLLRPITLWPFPEEALAAAASKVEGVLVVEMNAGQMVDDVRRVVAGRTAVHFFGRSGGVIPLPEEIEAAADAALAGAS